ncbi:MAG: TonB-dependent receptor plug domain-containing protein [Caulobacteraceae bacterium]|nr:TonB-dependent receptor plug domain-containing protein [Caulobacteraceae bacterium]
MSKFKTWLLAGAAALTGAGSVHAADAVQATTVGTVTVTADRAGLLERRPSRTVFGLAKPLIETPRAATQISDVTLQRYGVQTINNLVAVSPNSYTASFYGVPGSLDVRGTLADNYFLGFKLIENRGTYTTPIGDAAQIDIVRGPPSPIYGPGKVGGFLNFTPKSAKSESLTHPEGELDATVGSYGKKNLAGQVGAPLKLGTASGGIYAYGELEDSDSFYKGVHPKHQLGEVSVNYDLPGGWSADLDALYLHSSGDVQIPGWNRLTQSLVDDRTYITGHNITLSATPGVGYLTPAQATPTAFMPYPKNFTAVGGGLYAVYGPGVAIATPALPDFQLNSARAGTTVKLSPRDVLVGLDDFSDTTVPAVVLGLSKALSNDQSLNLQLFYNGLENKRFVSYGFPAWFRADVFEARATYQIKATAFEGWLTADTLAGLSYRNYQGRDMQSFNSGLIALDRRDLSAGATPTDTMCDPFAHGVTSDQTPADCIGWETDIHSREQDRGIFFTTDISAGRRLDLVVGAREDAYSVRSRDTGILSFEAVDSAQASHSAGTFTLSLSYKLGGGLMPYATYARGGALEVQQAGDLKPSDIASGGWLSSSDLAEGGVKFQLLGKTLVGSFDIYEQHRTQAAGLNAAVQRTESIGEELEVRYLATKNLSFTFSGDMQRTEVLGPDASTEYIPAYAVCGSTVSCELNSWGGTYLVFNFDQMPGRGGNYAFTPIPDTTASLYANYITDDHAWGRAGGTIGATYVSRTSGTIENAIIYPAYTLVNLSLFYRHGPYEADLNIDNLFDQFYVTPSSDLTYINVAAMPGVGREWRLTLRRRF